MWKTVSLSDVCNVSIGKTPPRGDKLYWDEEKITNNVWLSIADLSSSNDKYISDSKEYLSNEGASLFKSVPKNTLIMSFKLSIGKLAFTKCELRTNEAIAALSILDESLVLKEFLYYYLSSLNWDVLAGHDQKVKGKTLNKKKLNALEITLPPLAEQQRIVTKLDAAFAEIDKALEVLKLKEQEAKTLKDLLLSEKLCFTSHKKIKIGDVLKTGAGGTPLKSHKEYYENGDINWLLSGAVCEQNITKCKTHITQKGLQNSSAKIFPINTVLVAMYGATAGQVGILRIEAASNQAVCGIYPSSKYLPDFLYFYLKNYKNTLLKEASGTAQPNISQIKIKNIPIPLISVSEQKEIISLIENIFFSLNKFKITLSKIKDNYLSLKSSILSKELQSNEAA